MIKIIVKGKQGTGKTRICRVIQSALILDPKIKARLNQIQIIEESEGINVKKRIRYLITTEIE